jgi:glycosyltransferase involved in cell wall biosynthesis
MRSSLTTDPGTSALLSAAVVIRARNEKRFIGRTLAAIVDPAALQPRQVVVVDSGSTDGTLDILRAFGITLVRIRPQDFTYGYALNRGVAQTDADIVVSLSAHSTPAGPDWLRRLLEPFADPRAQLVMMNELFPSAATTEVNALLGFGSVALVLIIITRGRLGYWGGEVVVPPVIAADVGSACPEDRP